MDNKRKRNTSGPDLGEHQGLPTSRLRTESPSPERPRQFAQTGTGHPQVSTTPLSDRLPEGTVLAPGALETTVAGAQNDDAASMEDAAHAESSEEVVAEEELTDAPVVNVSSYIPSGFIKATDQFAINLDADYKNHALMKQVDNNEFGTKEEAGVVYALRDRRKSHAGQCLKIGKAGPTTLETRCKTYYDKRDYTARHVAMDVQVVKLREQVVGDDGETTDGELRTTQYVEDLTRTNAINALKDDHNTAEDGALLPWDNTGERLGRKGQGTPGAHGQLSGDWAGKKDADGTDVNNGLPLVDGEGNKRPGRWVKHANEKIVFADTGEVYQDGPSLEGTVEVRDLTADEKRDVKERIRNRTMPRSEYEEWVKVAGGAAKLASQLGAGASTLRRWVTKLS